jgi:dienelactone hydrolase
MRDKMNPQEYAHKRFDSIKPKYAWQGGNKNEITCWRRKTRQAIRHQLGMPSLSQKCPLNPKTINTELLDGYRRESITFETRNGLSAFGYFLIPDNHRAPSPAVLCIPGHGRGADSIAGIDIDGNQRSLHLHDEYQADFALQCIAQGYVAFALEQISFGKRRDDLAKSASPDTSSCHRDSMAALALGECMIGWRVWDAIRALDYLCSRPEVDIHRLGIMGISGGGTTSFWTSCMDSRISATVISGYFNTFKDSILSVTHCEDNYAPGMLQLLEMPDMAGLISPRAFFAENGRFDPIFPVSAFQKAVLRAMEIYKSCNAEDMFGYQIFEGDHRFCGEMAFPFLKKIWQSP